MPNLTPWVLCIKRKKTFSHCTAWYIIIHCNISIDPIQYIGLYYNTFMLEGWHFSHPQIEFIKSISFISCESRLLPFPLKLTPFKKVTKGNFLVICVYNGELCLSIQMVPEPVVLHSAIQTINICSYWSRLYPAFISKLLIFPKRPFLDAYHDILLWRSFLPPGYY